MLVDFKYYLHDGYNGYERVEFLRERVPEIAAMEMSDDDLVEAIGRPFYEVTLNCTFDTETAEIKVVGAEG